MDSIDYIWTSLFAFPVSWNELNYLSLHELTLFRVKSEGLNYGYSELLTTLYIKIFFYFICFQKLFYLGKVLLHFLSFFDGREILNYRSKEEKYLKYFFYHKMENITTGPLKMRKFWTVWDKMHAIRFQWLCSLSYK